MNELRRMAYLDALGVDSYVSRAQLPGAAVTQRLAIVSVAAKAPVAKASDNVADSVADSVAAVESPAVPLPAQGGRVARPDFGLSTRSEAAAVELPAAAPPRDQVVPRFSLIAIVVGDWLWLEEMGDMPLTTAQVQLVQAMARALTRGLGTDSTAAGQAVKPDIAQFDWPMHTNRQLDLSEAAAHASVAAFVSRRLEQHHCRGLVLLGESCAQRVPQTQVSGHIVSTASSAQILSNPSLKKQVWQDLQPLLVKA